MLLSGEFTGIVDGEVSKSKAFRRQAVEDGSADGTQHSLAVLVGDNLNDLGANAGLSDSDRRAYVMENSDRYGVYSPDEPAYIPTSSQPSSLGYCVHISLRVLNPVSCENY